MSANCSFFGSWFPSMDPVPPPNGPNYFRFYLRESEALKLFHAALDMMSRGYGPSRILEYKLVDMEVRFTSAHSGANYIGSIQKWRHVSVVPLRPVPDLFYSMICEIWEMDLVHGMSTTFPPDGEFDVPANEIYKRILTRARIVSNGRTLSLSTLLAIRAFAFCNMLMIPAATTEDIAGLSQEDVDLTVDFMELLVWNRPVSDRPVPLEYKEAIMENLDKMFWRAVKNMHGGKAVDGGGV